MAKNLPSINLFKNRQKHTIDKIVNWTLSVGRVIIIITEAVALSAFLYRFSLDRELIDLNDKIEQRVAQLEGAKRNEEIFRNLQERLTLIDQFIKIGQDTVTILQSIIALAPLDVTINNISLLETTVKLDINAQSVASLTQFVNSLKAHQKVEGVSIERIENRTSTATIGMGLTATLKKEKKK